MPAAFVLIRSRDACGACPVRELMDVIVRRGSAADHHESSSENQTKDQIVCIADGAQLHDAVYGEPI